MMGSDNPSQVIYGGLILVGSMAIIGLIDNFVRVIAEESGLWQFHLFRSTLASLVIVCYCLYRRQNLLPKRFWAVTLRSFLLTGAMIIYFGSLTLMPIAEAGATLFSAPIFLLVFSALLFGTKVGLVRILAVIAGFIGVLLVLKPDPANLHYFTFLPLLAGIFYALGQLVTRHLCADEHTSVVLLGFFLAIGLSGLVGSFAFSVFEVPEEWMIVAPFYVTGWVEPTGRFLFWTVVQCGGSLIAVSGLVRSYQIAEPTYIAVFEYSLLVFAGFWGWLLWKEIPDAIGIIGIVIIVGTGIVIVLRTRNLA